MKVIFLDIDGVMNTRLTPVSQNEEGHLLAMEQDKVFMLNVLIDKRPDIKVVLSSSWRYHDDWREQMLSNGLLFQFLDRCPVDGRYWSRGDEIHRWQNVHPEVTRYAILDDDPSMKLEQQPNFFRTYYDGDGLTKELLEAVVTHLDTE